jgi:hypothetical protein
VKLHRDARNRWTARVWAYRVFIDGDEVGRIEWGESCTYSVSPGAHDVRLRIDWCGRRTRSFSLRSGEELAVLCGPGRHWSGVFAFVLSPDDYIDLRRES